MARLLKNVPLLPIMDRLKTGLFLIARREAIVFSLLLLGVFFGITAKAFAQSNEPPNIAAIKSSSGNSFEILVNKISTLVENKTHVDLIVTPEYSLSPDIYYQHAKYSITIDCSEGYCSISDTGTAESTQVVNAVSQIQGLAGAHHVYIVLGTVSERVDTSDYPDLPPYTYFVTALIIDRDGHVVAGKRKTTQIFARGGQIKEGDQGYEDAYGLAMDTVRFFTLTNANGLTFKIFPIICSERDNPDMLDKAAEFNVDIVVETEREGDVAYEEITQQIQDGVDPDDFWRIEKIYITKYIDQRNVAKANSYLLVSDGGWWSIQGGIINFQKNKLALLDITDDYVYGEIDPSIVCKGDFDCDGDVDGTDLAVFAADFGRTDCTVDPPCEGDFDGDGNVDGSDLAVFAASFGRTNCLFCP